jgi:hypothetical protein
MPLILRLTVLATFCTGAAVLVVTVFRVATFQIYDETLSGEQFWSEGYGLFFVIIALIMIAAGIGIFKGRGWSRWLVLFIGGRRHQADPMWHLDRAQRVIPMGRKSMALLLDRAWRPKNRTGIGPHPRAPKRQDFSRINPLCQGGSEGGIQNIRQIITAKSGDCNRSLLRSSRCVINR